MTEPRAWGEHAIAHGDVLSVLSELPDNSFDALFCDPPYGYRFMGKRWDYSVPSQAVWEQALRVLKPGAPLLSFGGSRTYHRIAIGIEDAGFELRDSLMWLYGKGFPKSQNVSLAIDKAAGAVREVVGTRMLTGNAALTTKEKGGTFAVQVGSAPSKTIDVTAPSTPLAEEWEGYGTALKPAYEPIALARKPTVGTMVENVRQWSVGGLAIDACRIGRDEGDSSGWSKSGSSASDNLAMSGGNTERRAKPDAEGRWPANLILDEEAAAALDERTGPRPSNPYRENIASGAVLPLSKRTAGGVKERGEGPSRFFYTSKVSTRERNFGCDALPLRSAGEMTEREDGQDALDCPRTGAGRTGGARNSHPTLKPLSLNRWLAGLIRPPGAGAMLLVPYCGAGSEIIGALQAGWPSVFGIEGDSQYIEIAEARITAWRKAGDGT